MPGQATRHRSLEDLDKERFFHPFTSITDHLKAGPRVIDSAKRLTVTDRNGREYLDGAAGLWCVNVGYGREEIARAVYEQTRKLGFCHSFSSLANEPAIRLADRLVGLAPDNMSKVFFANSGSEANDTQVKLVWYYNNLLGRPRKKKIVARHRGFHGVTVASGSLTGLAHVHSAFDLPIGGVIHVSTPDCYRGLPAGVSEREYARSLAVELDAVIEAEGPDTVAAFIAEPVMGAGGVLVPPEGYFEEVQRVLDKHDVLMIVDEVISGFGRLGAWFGSDKYGIKPDLMSLAKGLTSGYVPMSACVISEKVWTVLAEGAPQVGQFAHGFTYSAHPVAAAAAMANLDILESEGLVVDAARVGGYFRRQLEETLADHPLVGDIRGVGLMIGVELVRDRTTKAGFPLEVKAGPRVMNRCLDEGLILRALPLSNVVAFSPPLVITEPDVDEVIARFRRGLEKATQELRWEGFVSDR
jgi:L-2,4-diaminobutyrate transaminase